VGSKQSYAMLHKVMQPQIQINAKHSNKYKSLKGIYKKQGIKNLKNNKL
jgi:hypothetical protein